MSLHDWFGRHIAHVESSHWEGGYFVTRCVHCDRPMVKLPGLPWRLRTGPA